AFDTLANLWPVRDENDAAGVQTALMPLHQLTDRASLLLTHHTRKSDGQEATASRGSGALPAFVDTIIELRRHSPTHRQDHRRVLTAYGRHDETPPEVVVELTDEGYVALGSRDDLATQAVAAVVESLLPAAPPGLTSDAILEKWPGETKP